MTVRHHDAPGVAPRRRHGIGRALTLAVAASLLLTATARAVEFQASPATARVNQSVTFTADPAGAATSSALSWAFGDGLTGAGASVTHAYPATGAYTVTLVATPLEGEPTTTSHAVSVVGDPAAAFTATPGTAEIGQAIGFDAAASADPGGAIASYAWSFGDGATASGEKPSHGFTTPGDHTITLTVTAALDGRTASISHTVHVNAPPVAAFSYASVGAPAEQNPLVPVVGQQVAFNAGGSSDPDGTVKSWAWDLGTGTFGAASASPTTSTTFPAAGTKAIRLRVVDDRGATSTQQIDVRVNAPPVAGFSIAPAAPLTGATVTLTSTATDPDGAADLATVGWDLDGDNVYTDATGPTATVVFLTAGNYVVGQKVVDQGGVTKYLNKAVVVSGPPAPVPPASPPGDEPDAIVPSPGAPALGDPTAPPAAEPAPADVPAPVTATATPAAPPRLLRGVRVTLSGSILRRRTRIARLVVVAPQGASVTARCRGRGCPRRSVRKTVASSGRLRLGALERTLWSGARVTVSVAKPGFVTRSIVLRMRRGRAPARTDGCLMPAAGGKTKLTKCPAR